MFFCGITHTSSHEDTDGIAETFSAEPAAEIIFRSAAGDPVLFIRGKHTDTGSDIDGRGKTVSAESAEQLSAGGVFTCKNMFPVIAAAGTGTGTDVDGGGEDIAAVPAKIFAGVAACSGKGVLAVVGTHTGTDTHIHGCTELVTAESADKVVVFARHNRMFPAA